MFQIFLFLIKFIYQGKPVSTKKEDFLTMYAIDPERLRAEDSRGMLRVSPLHYKTLEEIRRFGQALGRIAASDKGLSGAAY